MAVRIIAGEFRGRKILPPASDTTRPITDRAKQSLFDVLAPRIDGAVVYDCFAGTGSMGLESLSRGAAHVTFFERDRDALRRLKQNIDALQVAGRSRIIAADLFKWIDAPDGAPSDAGRADLLFLDPPYRFLVERPDRLRSLAAGLARTHLADAGIVVFRHDSRDRLDLPALARYDQREYGGMTIELLQRAS